MHVEKRIDDVAFFFFFFFFFFLSVTLPYSRTRKFLILAEAIERPYTGNVELTTLHMRNFAREHRRRRHIPTFGRFCPKKFFCRK